MVRWTPAVLHAFRGARFEDGALDVDVVKWLSAYREIVLDVAKTLWHRDNPTRQRLPKAFSDGFRLRLAKLERGSGLATLERSRSVEEQLTFQPEVFDRAMRLVEKSVTAASSGAPLPSEFPRSTLPKFRRWGESFRDDESVAILSPERDVRAEYTPEARAALLGRIETRYEDVADEIGYVLATSIRAGKFELYRDRHSGDGVDVPLEKEWEETVFAALASHDEVRLRVVGMGAYGAGGLVRFTRVERVELGDRSVDNASLWGAIDAVATAVPSAEWGKLAPDAAENHDKYI
jgi:hypothetical protein